MDMDESIKTSSEKKWMSDSDKIVLYMDIMGFKERVKNTEFLVLQKEFDTLCKTWKRRTSPLHTGDHIRDIHFSDSIILASDTVDDGSLNRVVIAGMVIMQEAMKMRFPINGAIAIGNFSFDEKNNISFGQGLVDAYQLQDSLFYYGIAIHPTVETLVRKAKRPQKFLSRLPIPLKGGWATHFQVNWSLIGNKYNYHDSTNEALMMLDRIEDGTTGNPRIYVENTRQVVLAMQKEYNRNNQK